MFERRVLAACLLFAAALVRAETLVFEGRAREPDSGRHLYTEQHRVRLDERGKYLSSSVTYVDPRGETIAVKEVDFDDKQAAPSFRFHDLRTGSRLRVDAGDSRLSVSSRDGGRERDTDLDIDAQARIVIDAGFDRFIQQEWEALLEGRTQSFLFLHAPRARLMEFEIVKAEESGNTVEFLIRPAGFLLGLLVKPVRLTYAADNRRLLRYRGVTNIAREAGGRVRDEHYVATIDYAYPRISTRRY